MYYNGLVNKERYTFMENIETMVEKLTSDLNIDFVQDVDNTSHGMKQINEFKLEIILSQDDTGYTDINLSLVGKTNKFGSNTFTRSNYKDVLESLNNVINNARVLVSSIENFTK